MNNLNTIEKVYSGLQTTSKKRVPTSFNNFETESNIAIKGDDAERELQNCSTLYAVYAVGMFGIRNFCNRYYGENFTDIIDISAFCPCR